MKVYLLYKTLEKNADTIGALEKPTAAIDTTCFIVSMLQLCMSSVIPQ